MNTEDHDFTQELRDMLAASDAGKFDKDAALALSDRIHEYEMEGGEITALESFLWGALTCDIESAA